MLNRTKLLLLMVLGISTLTTNAQRADSTIITFFVPTTQQAYPGRLAYKPTFIIKSDTINKYSLNGMPTGLPAFLASTIFYNKTIAFSQGNYNTNSVSTLNLLNNQISQANLSFTPTALASDAIAIFVGNGSGNQILRIKENLAIDNSFKCTLGAMDVCWGLKVDNDVLYALIANTPLSIYGPKCRIIALNRFTGAQIGSVDVGSSSLFTIKNNVIMVAKTYRDRWEPQTDKSTIRIYNAAVGNNSVTFSQVGSDINQNYSLMDLHLGSDGMAYGLCYQKKLIKISPTNASVLNTFNIEAGLSQMVIPMRMFTSNNKAFIFWAEDDNPAWSQIVVSDLSNPSIVKASHNTGENIRAMLMFNY